MPACALCENVQAAGEACEVCGHPFSPGERTPVVFEPLEGLEPTLLAAVQATPETVPELEATSVGPIEVAVSAMEDFLPTELEGVPADGVDDPPPAALCRYCRNPAPAGEAFCAHCGMRLPASSGGVEAPPPEVVLCRECSVPVPGTSCPGCGARVRG